jgi:hypothetical protein
MVRGRRKMEKIGSKRGKLVVFTDLMCPLKKLILPLRKTDDQSWTSLPDVNNG